MRNQPRLGILLPDALYTTSGVLQAIGIGDEALAAGRQSGHLHPTYKGRFAYYRGAELIAWILATGQPTRPRQIIDNELREKLPE
jgi:hypothetical protein